MAIDTTFTNRAFAKKKVKANPGLLRSQSEIKPSRKNFFYDTNNHTNSDVDDTTSTHIDTNISIVKIMTSPLRQPPIEPLYEMGDEIISTPKKGKLNKSNNNNQFMSSTQETDITSPLKKEANEKENDENLNIDPYRGRFYNIRTPDLNRIIKFRKSNASPGKNLLEKFKIEQDSDSDESSLSQEETTSRTHSTIANVNERTIPDINNQMSPTSVSNDKSIAIIKPLDEDETKNNNQVSNKFSENTFIYSLNSHFSTNQIGINGNPQSSIDNKDIENSDIDRQTLPSSPKDQIIFSVESKQSQSPNKINNALPLMHNHSNGTIIFDSQNNTFLGPSITQHGKYLEDTQIIPSTLTFSLDNKYNKLLESQRNPGYINEKQGLIPNEFTDQEETQLVSLKNDNNTSIVETQPIIYSHSSPSKNDKFGLHKSQTEIKSTILDGHANDIVIQPNQDSTDKIDTSYSQDKETSNIELPKTSSPEKKSSPSKLMYAIFPSQEEENDNLMKNRNTVKLEVSRVPIYGTVRNDLDSVESNHEIIESETDESQDLSEIDDDPEYIPTENEGSTSYPNIFKKVLESGRNTNKAVTNLQNLNVSQNTFTSQNSEIDDSQKIIIKRRSVKRHLETIEFSDKEEDRSTGASPYKKSKSIHNSKDEDDNDKNVTNNIDEYPNDYRTTDVESLTKKDIHFKNAIWCQYDVDLKYYPGILLEIDETNGNCSVLFASGRYTGKLEDISYLDIRIGDKVQDENNISYRVCGLQCLKHDPNTIRCIRGYDTVVLEKYSHIHNREHILKALCDIRITIESWAKRTKIEEPVFDDYESENYQNQKHVTRRHTRTQTISPRKTNRTKKLNYAEPESDDTDDDDLIKSQLEYMNERVTELSRNISKSNGKIFDKCLFALTGILSLQDGLVSCIEEGGGKIIKEGFRQLFEYDTLEQSDYFSTSHSLNLILKPKIISKNYRFACILSNRHLRSLKYLETLALGWPTLHWKFIEACIMHNKIVPTLVYQYLLPSGVSFRLGSTCENEKPPILSNDIFEFHSNFIKDTALQKQIRLRKNILEGYTIILCGKLDLDDMLKFCFAALGVSHLIHTYNINDLMIKEPSFIDNIINRNDPCIHKVIFFINEKEKKITSLLKKIRSTFSERYKEPNIEYHIETKEWLIQTLINRDHGFS